MAALSEFIRAYEREHGEIGQQETDCAYRSAHGRAVVVRGLAGTNVVPSRVAKTPDGDDIVTSDPGDLVTVAEWADLHVDVITV